MRARAVRVGDAETLPLFNLGCAGFGRSRKAQLAGGAKIRIAIVGCGDWGGTLLRRAGALNARSSAPYAHNDWTLGGVGIRFKF